MVTSGRAPPAPPVPAPPHAVTAMTAAKSTPSIVRPGFMSPPPAVALRLPALREYDRPCRTWDERLGRRGHSRRQGGPLERRERELRRDGQQRHQQRSGEELVVLLEGEAVDDEPAKGPAGDEGAERGGGHDVHRGGADPGEHERQAERDLDRPQDLRLAEPHAARGLHDVTVDAAHRDERVREERRDRERHEREERRPEAEAEAERERQRQREREQRERRQGAADVRDVDRDEAAASDVTEVERERDRGENADRHRETRKLEMLGHPDRYPVRPLPVGRVGEPSRDVADEPHPTRLHGVSARCTRTSAPSASTARATESAAPRISGVLKKSWMPKRIR